MSRFNMICMSVTALCNFILILKGSGEIANWIAFICCSLAVILNLIIEYRNAKRAK